MGLAQPPYLCVKIRMLLSVSILSIVDFHFNFRASKIYILRIHVLAITQSQTMKCLKMELRSWGMRTCVPLIKVLPEGGVITTIGNDGRCHIQPSAREVIDVDLFNDLGSGWCNAAV